MYVGTIHPHHVPTVLSMFEAKKPVLCEKPLTMNAGDTSRLISVAKEKNLFFMEVGDCQCCILISAWGRHFCVGNHPVIVHESRHSTLCVQTSGSTF